MTFTKFVLAALMVSASFSAHAEETAAKAKADVKEAGHDIKVGAKKAGRKIKDETCELVNGKMECAAKKAGHAIENKVDEVKK